MDSDIFYCVFCGSGCRVACFPTHCEKYTCHNPFCSAHGPVLQDAPQEKTTSASTGCRNGNLGQQSNDTSFVSQADDAATGLAHQPDDPSVSHGLAADISPHAYLFSKTATTSTMGQYNEIIPSGRSKSEEIQMIRSPDMEPSITEVEPGLFVGNIHCIKERFLREMGITAVVTFYTSPISDKHDSHMRQTIPLKTRLFLKAVNSKKQDLIQYFPGACEFIDRRLVGDIRSPTSPRCRLIPGTDDHSAPTSTETQTRPMHARVSRRSQPYPATPTTPRRSRKSSFIAARASLDQSPL